MAKGLYKEWLEPDNLTKLRGWARDGLNDKQIAHNMGIHVSTLYEWKNNYPDINDALKKGKEIVDYEVENALLKSALGYEVNEAYVEEVEEVDADGKPTGRKKVYKKKTRKFIPPNTAAQIFWLKNRKPDRWKDKIDKDINLEVEDLTPLAELIKVEETDD